MKAKEPKRIWDNYEEVAEVLKSKRIKLVIAAATREGVRYINIREFYLRQKDNVWRPGRDGITIPLTLPVDFNESTNEISYINPSDGLLAGVTRAVAVAKDMALSDPEKAVYTVPKEA